MTVGQIIKELKKYDPNLELECSVDMSVEGNEDTYDDRCFGMEPYLIRESLDVRINKKYVQIFFEKRGSKLLLGERESFLGSPPLVHLLHILPCSIIIISYCYYF